MTIRRLKPADPPTGNELDVRLPGVDVARILWVIFTVNTSATAGNRRPMLEVQDDDGDVIQKVNADEITGSDTSRRYVFADLGSTWTSVDSFNPIGEMYVLSAAGRIATSTANFDSGDSIQNVVIVYEDDP